MDPKIIEALWFVLPAYVANSVAADVSIIGFLRKYNHPVDGGKTFRGKRILGDGKTWRGLFFGVLGGVFVGWLQSKYYWRVFELLQPLASPAELNLQQMTLTLAFLISLGAMVGDMVESFGKRMMGLPSGHPAPILDQLDYIFGAFFFAWLVVPVNLDYFALAVLITIPLHVVANIVAWALKIKRVWW